MIPTFLFLFFISLISSVQPFRFVAPRAEPPPSLGIRRTIFTQQVGGKPYKWYTYGAVVTYNDKVAKLFPEDAQIAGLAYQAWGEAKELNSDDDYPFAGMSVLLVDNQAIFASPLKQTGNQGVIAHTDGQPSPFFFEDIVPANAPVKQQLLACALENNREGKSRHNTHGNCGEIVTMQMWHLNHPNTEWDKGAGARVTYWYNARGSTINPCKGGNKPYRWGCMQWAEQNGISWVDEDHSPDMMEMSTHIPGESVSFDTLWCEGWEERPENLLSYRPPTPPPPPKRKLSPSFDAEDGFDSDEWDDAWLKLLG
ncbi:Nn.00g080300.m01.CDS01 [Neocucurbitaria sp. VM-36]